MITYIIISFLMMVTPGPGVLSLAGVGAGFGWKVGMMYLIGLFFGTNGVALLVVLGFKQFLFEIDGVPKTLAEEAFELAAAKLPNKNKFVKRLGL